MMFREGGARGTNVDGGAGASRYRREWLEESCDGKNGEVTKGVGDEGRGISV